jgi:hypothetical protein
MWFLNLETPVLDLCMIVRGFTLGYLPKPPPAAPKCAIIAPKGFREESPGLFTPGRSYITPNFPARGYRTFTHDPRPTTHDLCPTPQNHSIVSGLVLHDLNIFKSRLVE